MSGACATSTSTQNENPDKLAAVGRIIGEFGVGLKDAVATLDRNGVAVEIESSHGVITLTQVAKHGFGEIVTLHAAVLLPWDPGFAGTRVRLPGLSDADMAPGCQSSMLSPRRIC